MIWVSVVPVVSLRCLRGCDFMDSVGAVLNFANRTLECSFLNATLQRLDQLSAGHFMLPLLPLRWLRLESGAWRKCGLNGIIELQLDPAEWLKRRIAEGVKDHPISSDDFKHEHNLTESGMCESGWHGTDSTECITAAKKMCASQQTHFEQPTCRRTPGPRQSCCLS